MKALVGLILLVALITIWFAGRSHAQTKKSQTQSSDVGRQLRRLMLEMPPQQTNTHPTDEFPKVYGVLMDWPIGDGQVATVFSASSGDASLYTTSTFGVIGGAGHESVKVAARKFVRAAGAVLTDSAPTTEFPYPASGHLRFYLLTFEGVRVIDADLASVTKGTNKHSALFGLGQDVLTELRLTGEKRP